MDLASDFIHVGPEPADPGAAYRFVQTPEAGAATQFLGTVRNHNAGATVTQLAYEAYAEMAEAEIARIVAAAHARWTILKTHTVHRTGDLAIGDIAVCVTVSSAHRDAAFAACRYIIDELKKCTPIWKSETLTDGSARWVEESRPEAPANS